MGQLFIYGTLRDRRIFRSVTGHRFRLHDEPQRAGALPAERAVLDGWDTLSPDSLYLYAVPRANSRIHGVLIRGIPDSVWPRLDNFEGPRYQRRIVEVIGRAH